MSATRTTLTATLFLAHIKAWVNERGTMGVYGHFNNDDTEVKL